MNSARISVAGRVHYFSDKPARTSWAGFRSEVITLRVLGTSRSE
jgi:hypothetical protein